MSMREVTDVKVVVYAGAAPGSHSNFLSSLFPGFFFFFFFCILLHILLHIFVNVFFFFSFSPITMIIDYTFHMWDPAPYTCQEVEGKVLLNPKNDEFHTQGFSSLCLSLLSLSVSWIIDPRCLDFFAFFMSGYLHLLISFFYKGMFTDEVAASYANDRPLFISDIRSVDWEMTTDVDTEKKVFFFDSCPSF